MIANNKIQKLAVSKDTEKSLRYLYELYLYKKVFLLFYSREIKKLKKKYPRKSINIPVILENILKMKNKNPYETFSNFTDRENNKLGRVIKVILCKDKNVLNNQIITVREFNKIKNKMEIIQENYKNTLEELSALKEKTKKFI